FDLSATIRVAVRDGQHAVAVKGLHKLLDYQPWRTELWERAGIEQYLQGQNELAIHDLKQAEGQLTILGLDTLANAYEKSGQYAAASDMWARVVARQPTPEEYDRLVETLWKAGAMDEAIRALRGWQQLEPFNPQVAFRLGLFLSADHPEEALSQLTEAVRLKPDYAADLDVMQRAFALADLNADDGYRYTVIGRALASLNEWDLAEQSFRKATQANPTYAEAWALLGEAHLQLGQDGSGELAKALELNPNSVLSRALMALYLGRGERWDEAIDQLRQAARLEPDRAVWRIEIGNLYAQKGDLIAAQKEFQAAIDLEPRNAQTWYAMASFSYQYAFDLDQTGEPAAREVLAINEKDARGNDLLGAILIELGRDVDGEKYLMKAQELNPGLAEAYLHLGSLYLQRQQMAGAYEQLSRAVRLDPNGVTGELARRLLERYFDDPSLGTPPP
ncbi:MAG TPA: tetratricopeptide repeat protein, partial [Anaerolinea sp.]|nr:tetratricopeptide repeat protein [Anaerolinea sp.]